MRGESQSREKCLQEWRIDTFHQITFVYPYELKTNVLLWFRTTYRNQFICFLNKFPHELIFLKIIKMKTQFSFNALMLLLLIVFALEYRHYLPSFRLLKKKQNGRFLASFIYWHKLSPLVITVWNPRFLFTSVECFC